MNISTFPVYSTNIFPLANDSKAGGQYMTEYNLRTRESVGTSQKVKYMIGPSFVHCEDDFEVRIQEDGAGVQISSTTLEILPGRAVVNGHFIESLETVTLDIASLNAQAKLQDQPPISGTDLCIGLRAMYSTEQTMAGAMRANNTEDIYLPSLNYKLKEKNYLEIYYDNYVEIWFPLTWLFSLYKSKDLNILNLYNKYGGYYYERRNAKVLFKNKYLY